MPLIEKIFNPFIYFHHKRISKYLYNLDINKVIDVGSHKGEFLETVLKIQNIDF